MDKRLKVVVITQEDVFFIPKNIKLLSEVCDLVEIVNLKHKSSLENKVSDFVKWFGIIQVAKLGFKVIKQKIKSIIDRLFLYKIFKGECSVKDVASFLSVPYLEIKNVNSKYFIKKHLKEISPDLVVSYSAPQVFKEEVLSIPRLGAINVHGSYLPDYRGCLPSFW